MRPVNCGHTSSRLWPKESGAPMTAPWTSIENTRPKVRVAGCSMPTVASPSLAAAGMYFEGVPAHDHDMVPLAVLMLVGRTVRVIAAPVLVDVAAPVTSIVPAAPTVAPEIFPATLMVIPVPMVALEDGSVWNFSVIPVRALEAARISSDTLARMV